MASFDDPSFFGEQWADVYDGEPAQQLPEVDFLAGLATGRVLELAIGTGRVGLPLAQTGVSVEGIEASQAMVDKLRAKPGGDTIQVTIGDMADVAVDGPYQMVFLVFNTLFNLITQQRQVDCFANVARVLEPGGVFVLECFLPDPAAYDRGVRTDDVDEESVDFTLTKHDPVLQRIAMQHITVDAQGFHLGPTLLRYAWPSELDLMAQLAGLRLRERYGDWARRPFDKTSRSHVSVYERA
jgi:SAM-dependent methyltransferase